MKNITQNPEYHCYLVYQYRVLRSNKIYAAHNNLYFEYRKYLTKIYEE